jgi:hypothetical protein
MTFVMSVHPSACISMACNRLSELKFYAVDLSENVLRGSICVEIGQKYQAPYMST